MQTYICVSNSPRSLEYPSQMQCRRKSHLVPAGKHGFGLKGKGGGKGKGSGGCGGGYD